LSYGKKNEVTSLLILSPDKQLNDTKRIFYCLLIDNEKTKILKEKNIREILSCINCDACSIVCPIFVNNGEEADDKIRSGPIGAVIAPVLHGVVPYSRLSFKSTLCGACTKICPVDINLHKLLLHNRNNSINSGCETIKSQKSFKAYSFVLMRRKYFDRFPAKFKDMALKLFLSKAIKAKVRFPHFAKEPFSLVWRRLKGE
jgi:L-lactate dehydrogenase complex protein LldF